MKITDGYLIDKDCFYCPHSIKGKPLDDDLPIYEYTCEFANKILEADMVIPHWCPLENYKKEETI